MDKNNLVHNFTGLQFHQFNRITGKLADRLTRRSFTLIELLISVTIFSVVSIAIYSTFDSGMRIWRRMEKFNLADIRPLIKIEKMSAELRQTFIFRGGDFAFSGDKQKIQILVIIDSELNRVTYFFEKGSKIILRRCDKFKDIKLAKRNKEEMVSKPIQFLNGVSEFNFSYFYFDSEKGIYLWKEEWEENILPLAVKINITLQNETYSKTIFIPSA